MSRRSFADRSLAAALTTLMAATPLLTATPVRAEAATLEQGQEVNSFNMSDVTASVQGANAAAGKSTAMKARRTPVSSSGSYQTSIPISVPPGRLGMTPSLALSYDSANFRRETEFGTGWSFGVPTISLSTSKGYPALKRVNGVLSYDLDNAIISTPAGEAKKWTGTSTELPLSVLGSGTFYVPLRETEPVRYEYEPVTNRWAEHLPSGIKRYYGTAARVITELGTFTWHLTQEVDLSGNTIDYAYDKGSATETRTDKTAAQDAPLLRTVSWGGNSNAGLSHPFKVVLLNEPLARPIGAGTYAGAGAPDFLSGNIQRSKHVTKIKVCGPAGDALINDATFQYGAADSDCAPGVAYGDYQLTHKFSMPTGRSMLPTVTQHTFGTGATTKTWEYDYSGTLEPPVPAFETAERYFGQANSYLLATIPVDSSLTMRDTMDPPQHSAGGQLVDMDGDGLPEIVYLPAGLGSPHSRILESTNIELTNQPARRSATQRVPAGPDPLAAASESTWWQTPFTPIGAGFSANQRYTDLADVDGDGRTDAFFFQVDESTQMFPPRRGGECYANAVYELCGAFGPGGYVSMCEATPSCVSDLSRIAHVDFTLCDAAYCNMTEQSLADVFTDWDPEEWRQYSPSSAEGKAVLSGRAEWLDNGYFRVTTADVIAQINATNAPMPPKPTGPLTGHALLDFCSALIKACHGGQASLGIGFFRVQNGDDLPGQNYFEQDYAGPGAFNGWGNHVWRAAQRVDADLYRGSPGVYRIPGVMLHGWPTGVSKHAVQFTINPPEPPNEPNHFEVLAQHDFNAPVLDMNADGKADIIVLKVVDRELGNEYQPAAEFTPAAFIARTGADWVSDDGEELESWPGAVVAGSDFTASLRSLLVKTGTGPLPSGTAEEGTLFEYGPQYNAQLLDMNGDGLPDLVSAKQPSPLLCPVAPPRLQKYRAYGVPGHDTFLNRGYAFTRSARPIASPFVDAMGVVRKRTGARDCTNEPAPLIANPTGDRPAPMDMVSYADINADGRLDVVIAGRVTVVGGQNFTVSVVYLNHGVGFVAVDGGLGQSASGFAISELTVHVANNVVFTQPDRGRLVDVDADGLVDLVFPGISTFNKATQQLTPGWAYWRRNTGQVPDLLIREEMSTGASVEVEYVAATSRAARVGGVVRTTSEVPLLPPSMMLVKKIDQRTQLKTSDCSLPPAGSLCGDKETITMTYWDYAKDAHFNETLGFKRVDATFLNHSYGAPTTSAVLKQTFFHDSIVGGSALPYPLRGMLKESTYSSGTWSMDDYSAYDVLGLGPDNGWARIRSKGSMHVETDTSTVPATVARVGSTTSTRDTLGFPLTSVEGEAIPGANGTWTIDANLRRSTTSTYQHLTSVWALGLPTSAVVTGRGYTLNGTPPTLTMSASATLRSSSTTFDAVGRVTSRTDQKGPHSLCTTAPAASTTTFSIFNNVGLPTTVALHNQRVTVALTYDTLKLYQRTAAVNIQRWLDGTTPYGASTYLSTLTMMDPRTGKPVATVGPNGERTENTMDGFGRPLASYSALGQLTKQASYADLEYPNGVTELVVNQMSGSTISQALKRTTKLDGAGRPMEVFEETVGGSSADTVRVSAVKRDGFGNDVATYLPEREPYTFLAMTKAFDGMSRVTSVTTPDATTGRTTTTTYLPRVTTVINPRGNAQTPPANNVLATRTTVDWTGEAASIVQYGLSSEPPATTSIVRDAMGQPVSLTDPDGKVREVAWDQAGRLTRFTLAHNTGATPLATLRCYGPDDGLITQTNGVGETLTVTVDALGRMVKQVVTSAYLPAETLTTSYDAPSTPYGLGRVTRYTNGAGYWDHLLYDVRGYPLEVALNGHAQWAGMGPVPARTAFKGMLAYDRQGRLTSAQVSSYGAGATVQYGLFNYARDARGRLSNVTSGDNFILAHYVNNLEYDAQGRMTTAKFADNGLVATWGYHPQTQELTLIRYVANGLTQAQMAYDNHDKNGNIGREIRAVRVNGTWTPVIKPYTYDGLDRLKTGPDGSLSDTYEYTPGGDITRGGSYYDPTNGATYESYGYNNASLAHATTSILPSKKYAFAIRDLAYDNAGRLRTSTLQTSPAQQTVYTFNAGDCLRRMAFTHPGTGVSYTTDQWCDAEGNRVVRSTLAGTARKRMVPFLGLGEIRPDDGVGLFVWRLPVNGTVAVEEARKLSDGTFVGGAESGFVMSDVRGSVVAETDLQAVPVIVEAHEYDPYGDERTVGALPLSEHGYVGGERDPEFGVYTYGVRTYDPSLRRWLSQEPEWLSQGPIGLNAYQYAGNNPIVNVDITGRDLRFGQHSDIQVAKWELARSASSAGLVRTLRENRSVVVDVSVGNATEAGLRAIKADPSIKDKDNAMRQFALTRATATVVPTAGSDGKQALTVVVDADQLRLDNQARVARGEAAWSIGEVVRHELEHVQDKVNGRFPGELQAHRGQAAHRNDSGLPGSRDLDAQVEDLTVKEKQLKQVNERRKDSGLPALNQ